MDCQGCGHDPMAVVGDPVAAGSWGLGYEAVAAEFDYQSGDTFASSVSFVSINGWAAVEEAGEVLVAEASNREVPVEGGSKQGQVAVVEWVEAGVASPVEGPWPAQGIESLDVFAF